MCLNNILNKYKILDFDPDWIIGLCLSFGLLIIVCCLGIPDSTCCCGLLDIAC